MSVLSRILSRSFNARTLSGSDSVNFREFCELALNLLLLLLPISAHPLVHFDRGGFIDRYHHCFALKAAAEKMRNDVLRDFIQSVVARDDVILPPKLALQLTFSLFV
jgi:hypothetical protein